MYRACVSVLKKTVRQEHALKSHAYILRNLFRTNTINKMEIASPQSFDGGTFIRTVKEYLKIGGRCLHTSQPAMTHLLSVEEIFSKKSLQDYLNKLETEHRDCLKIVNLPPGEDICGDLKMRSTRVAQLAPLVECVKQLQLKQKELEEIEVLLKEDDPDIRDLAETERVACQEAIQDLKKKILSHLVPPEKGDESNLVLEVTAGIGGQEAMLFTAELFDMYQNFATFQGWDFEVLDYMPSEIVQGSQKLRLALWVFRLPPDLHLETPGGLRHACASVSGPKSYQKMKFEGGVHRVQRVPKTEKQGRMHTSTTTVAVLPQPTEITLNINTKDLRIETKRASGAGGQHVNTTDSAVRIVHIPTGVAAECQQERSQLRNKDKAMQVLRAKLYGLRLEEEASKVKQARKIQIGTRARSEKIRTYNFSQDRVTDHRIGKSLHDLKEFMLGEDLLEEMSRSLQQLSEQEALMDILD